MDGQRFDALARSLSRLSRRDAVKGLAGAPVAAVALGGVRVASAACRADGDSCSQNADCCDGACDGGACLNNANCRRGGDSCVQDSACCGRDRHSGTCRG